MIIEGNRERFTDLYNQESDALFRFCLFRVSDREKALELTQEAFTRLWVSMSLGKKIENPKALLFAVARNLIIDWYRKIKPISLAEDFDLADENSLLSIEISSDARRAIEILKSLDPQYRDVIYLRFMEDLAPQEIAKILDLNANIVSIRISRGMEALRELMGVKKKGNE